MKLTGVVYFPKKVSPSGTIVVQHERPATRRGVDAEVEGDKRGTIREVVIGYRYDPVTMKLVEVKTTVDSQDSW